MAMPGTSPGLNHSLEIHVCGRSRMPRSSSSSWSVLTQSSSQVPLTVTLRLERRCLSNSSSDSFAPPSAAYSHRALSVIFSPVPHPLYKHKIEHKTRPLPEQPHTPAQQL